VEAFKFLDRSGTAALTGHAWPLPSGAAPGLWVEATDVRPCEVGLHACTGEDLAYWISEELWVVELDGDIVHGRHKLAARRGRLLRRVDAWRAQVAAELAADVASRSRDLAVHVLRDYGHTRAAARLAACASGADTPAVAATISDEIGEASVAGTAALLAADCARFAARGTTPSAAFVAACAAGNGARQADGPEAEFTTAFHAERARQSRWIAERLAAARRRRWRRYPRS